MDEIKHDRPAAASVVERVLCLERLAPDARRALGIDDAMIPIACGVEGTEDLSATSAPR